MVLLTMTDAIVDALKSLPASSEIPNADEAGLNGEPTSTGNQDMSDPEVGKPIGHGDIVHLWKQLQTAQAGSSPSLEQLLRGAQVYIPPPPPKKEPTAEYKALMARLRREEEARSYERMVAPPPVHETFSSRFPNAPSSRAAAAAAFSAVNQPASKDDLGDDDATYNDVHRQFLLLINFLVSIVGVAGTLWVAGRWWSLPARLFLTMGGALVVAVAEVAVYSIYVWKLGDSKKRQETAKEFREVIDTWVVTEEKGGEDGGGGEEQLLRSKDDTLDGVRKRLTTNKDGMAD